MFTQEFEKNAGFFSSVGKKVSGWGKSMGNMGSKLKKDHMGKATDKAKSRYGRMKEHKINTNIGKGVVGAGAVGAVGTGLAMSGSNPSVTNNSSYQAY